MRTKAFSLVELLVTMSVIALLTAILMPGLSRAKLSAKVLMVNSDLYNIGMALEAYADSNKGKYPPERGSCENPINFNPLPGELFAYLPMKSDKEWVEVGMMDRFNPDFSYKYCCAGDTILNETQYCENMADLWVPDGFPYERDSGGQYYNDPKVSPVTWVVFSIGPRFDHQKMAEMHFPVPRQTWFNPQKKSGILPRMRLQNGQHIGSFSQ